MSARWLVVHLVAFRLERAGYDAEEVAALVAEVKNATRLVALTPAARERGLRPTMTATEARALVPDVILEPLDEAGEQEDRAALARVFQRYSDRVSPLGEEDVALDVGNTARLFGGEEALAAALVRLVVGMGHRCRIAVADDPIAAAALAVASPHDTLVTPPGGGGDALAELPIEILSPPPEVLDGLHAAGIEKIGQWARLDPAAVSGRYGEAGARLHRAARGLPCPEVNDPDPAAAPVQQKLRDPGEIAEAAVLGGPTSTFEPIRFVLSGLLAKLSLALEARDRLAVRLAVRLGTDRGPPRLVRLRVGRPTRDPRALERVVRARLEAVRLDAPAVEVGVRVEEHCPTRGWQPGLLDRTEAAEEMADLVARLCDTLGEEAVFAAGPFPSWRPEASWRARPFVPPEQEAFGGPAGTPAPREEELRARGGRLDPVAIQERWERVRSLPRPSLLRGRPERVEVREEGERPSLLRLPRGWEPITRARGPERLDGEWWCEDGGFDREYWVIEVGGAIGWIYRDRRSGVPDSWYLHGWFD